jgi:hypothetical protein
LGSRAQEAAQEVDLLFREILPEARRGKSKKSVPVPEIEVA